MSSETKRKMAISVIEHMPRIHGVPGFEFWWDMGTLRFTYFQIYIDCLFPLSVRFIVQEEITFNKLVTDDVAGYLNSQIVFGFFL